MADVKQKENFIQLKKDNILRIGIRDAEGNETGEHLEFDMEDIELPLRLSECEEKHRKNVQYIKMQFQIIDKRQDTKGKKLLSKNEEDKIKLLNEFYKREMESLDLFLGEGGTKKLLNGRNPYFTMYDDIGEILQPILPKLKMRAEDITKKIKDKYSNAKDKNVLE